MKTIIISKNGIVKLNKKSPETRRLFKLQVDKLSKLDKKEGK